METCTTEAGLFKKKLCGQAAVTHCANCEQPLCKQHAVAKKPGVFLCKECSAAAEQFDKNQTDVAKHEKAKRDADMMKSLAAAPAPKPKQPGAPGAAPGAVPGAAAPAAKEPEKKPDEDAPLEFTPTKKQ
jgi:hypothetical protein